VTLTQAGGGHSGNFAAQLTNPTTAGTCTLNDSPNWVNPTAGIGTKYNASVWVRGGAAGASIKLRTVEYSTSGANVGSASTTATLTTSWQKLSVSYTTVATASSLDFNAYVTNAPVGICFYADDAAVYVP